MTGSLATMQTPARRRSPTAVDGRDRQPRCGEPSRRRPRTRRPTRNTGCPYAKNLVAEAIRDIVLAYRAANPALKYVVIVGADQAIPFFRYPDAAGLGPESDYVPPVLDTTRLAGEPAAQLLPVAGRLRQPRPSCSSKGVTLPVPDLPVGRLVETPAEISGMIDAFLGRPACCDPTSSLVTGYDFLTDGADAACRTPSAPASAGAGADSLITNQDVDPTNIGPPPGQSWTADQLRTELLGKRHDLVFLAGHFSANNLLAADYATTMNASELDRVEREPRELARLQRRAATRATRSSMATPCRTSRRRSTGSRRSPRSGRR